MCYRGDRLAYLNSNFKGPDNLHGEEGAPLAAYRHSLLMGEGDSTFQSAKPVTAGRRGRGAKRKLPLDSESSISFLLEHCLIILTWGFSQSGLCENVGCNGNL